MLSRTLILAAVTLCIGTYETPAVAQNLEAGKTPSQIFTATCALCHKSSRSLLKTVAPGSLPGFLCQHYTTSQEMASAMSAYVLSNGASDKRIGGEDGLTREGKDSRTLQTPAEPGVAPKETRGKSRRELREEKKREEGEAAAKQKEEPKQAGDAARHPENGAEASPKEKGKREKRKPKPSVVHDEPQGEVGTKPGAAAAEPKAVPKSEPEPAAKPQPEQPQTPAAKPSEAPKAQTETRPDPVPAVTPAPETPPEPAPVPKPAEQPEKSDVSPKSQSKPDSSQKASGDSKSDDDKPAAASSGLPVFDIKPPAEPAPSEPPISPAGAPNAPISQ